MRRTDFTILFHDDVDWTYGGVTRFEWEAGIVLVRTVGLTGWLPGELERGVGMRTVEGWVRWWVGGGRRLHIPVGWGVHGFHDGEGVRCDACEIRLCVFLLLGEGVESAKVEGGGRSGVKGSGTGNARVVFARAIEGWHVGLEFRGERDHGGSGGRGGGERLRTRGRGSGTK